MILLLKLSHSLPEVKLAAIFDSSFNDLTYYKVWLLLFWKYFSINHFLYSEIYDFYLCHLLSWLYYSKSCLAGFSLSCSALFIPHITFKGIFQYQCFHSTHQLEALTWLFFIACFVPVHVYPPGSFAYSMCFSLPCPSAFQNSTLTKISCAYSIINVFFFILFFWDLLFLFLKKKNLIEG